MLGYLLCIAIHKEYWENANMEFVFTAIIKEKCLSLKCFSDLENCTWCKDLRLYHNFTYTPTIYLIHPKPTLHCSFSSENAHSKYLKNNATYKTLLREFYSLLSNEIWYATGDKWWSIIASKHCSKNILKEYERKSFVQLVVILIGQFHFQWRNRIFCFLLFIEIIFISHFGKGLNFIF